MFSRYCSNANLYHGPVTLAPTDEDFWLLLELAGALKVQREFPQQSDTLAQPTNAALTDQELLFLLSHDVVPPCHG
jgi:hypothetical protein